MRGSGMDARLLRELCEQAIVSDDPERIADLLSLTTMLLDAKREQLILLRRRAQRPTKHCKDAA